jgi:hypothetical protein
VPLQVKVEAPVVGQSAQVAEQYRYPLLQVTEQVDPLHAGTPLAGAVQGVHDVVPHDVTLVFAEHAPEQT